METAEIREGMSLKSFPRAIKDVINAILDINMINMHIPLMKTRILIFFPVIILEAGQLEFILLFNMKDGC